MQFESERISSTTGNRLHGRWLVLLRIAWLAIITASIVLVAIDLPRYYAQLLTQTGDSLLDSELVRSILRELGLPFTFYVAIQLVNETARVLGFLAIGALLLWRRPYDRGAIYFGFMLIFFSAGSGYTAAAVLIGQRFADFIGNLGFLAIFFSGYLFPDGRFVPRWTRWLMIVWIATAAGVGFFPGTPLDLNTWPPLILGPFILLLFGSGPYALFYRYRHVATPAQRQQIKWVGFGFTTAIATFLAVWLPILSQVPMLAQPQIAALYELIGGTLGILGFLLIPLSFGFAILRYRLYDIDVIVRRTLVYSLLTALLALLYFGSVVVLQGLFTAAAGRQPALIIVVSTLLIAALFTPLRRKIQNGIDRRFYRRKYDAAQTLASFAATARDEVELEQLTAELLHVIQDTMQPAHVSLWLRPLGKGKAAPGMPIDSYHRESIA